MTIIEEEFTDIALVGDDVTVSFHGRPIRPTSTVTGLVTPKRVPVRAVDGKITSPELDPGPCEVLIETGRWKREYSIVVPSEGTHRLRDLIETYETPAPPVVSLVKKFRDETIEARDIAVAAAEGVAGITDDLEKIAEDRAATERARDEAKESEVAASESRAASGIAAKAAGDSATSAGESEVETAGHSRRASDSAAAAALSEEAAGRHQEDSKAAAELAAQTAAGIEDVAADAAQVKLDRQVVESAVDEVSADRQTVTAAVEDVVAAKGDVEQIKTDVGQAKASIENTVTLVEGTLEQYGTQFIADREASQKAVTDATTLAKRSEDAADISVEEAANASQSALEAKRFRDEAEGVVTGVSSFDGQTGAVTKADVALDNVDNTRDMDKPLSVLQAEALTSIEQSGQIYTDGKIAPLETELANTTATATQTATNLAYMVDSANEPLGILVLGEDGKIMSPQLPSYVDDVLEYASLAVFPNPGEKGKIYTAEDTNQVYRWGGSAYIEVSPSPGSTDAVPEGQVNLYFTNARAVAAAKSGLQVPYPLTMAATLGTRKVGMTELVTGTGPLADAVTFSKMALTFETADASGDTVVQILKNGGVVSGMALTCSAAAQAGAIAGRTATGAWSFAAGDVLTVQIVSVGNTPGKGLTVSLTGRAGIPA